jgi:hypothetical protein
MRLTRSLSFPSLPLRATRPSFSTVSLTPRLRSRAHRFQFAPTGFAEWLERIFVSRPDKGAQFLYGKIRGEVLLGYEVHDSFRLYQYDIRGTKANAIEQRVTIEQNSGFSK